MRQTEVEPGMQRMPLVVVQLEGTAVRRREIGQATSYCPRTKCLRIGIGKVNLSPVKELRRTNTHFPAVQARMVDGQREKDVGVAECVVIEIVSCALMVVVHFHRPTSQWNGQSELVFFIALSVQGNEAQPLRYGETEQRATYRGKRRSLVVAAPKPSQHPVQMRDANRTPKPGIGCVFRNSSSEMCQPESGSQRQPGEQPVLVF